MWPVILNRLEQILLGIEQLLNACTPGGFCDECISARSWRERKNSLAWVILWKSIDFVALVIFRQKHHCYKSWVSEFDRHQLPAAYRQP